MKLQNTLHYKTSIQVMNSTIFYREKLLMPFWWSLPASLLITIITMEIKIAIPAISTGLTYSVLIVLLAIFLIWFNSSDLKIIKDYKCNIDICINNAYLPSKKILLATKLSKSLKSEALGYQLDPAAYVLHKTWISSMVLIVIDDPDDPTPYWLVSSRHPDRVISAIYS